jgi:hypothetical protein
MLSVFLRNLKLIAQVFRTIKEPGLLFHVTVVRVKCTLVCIYKS